jgi:hypothetical protein
MPSLCPLPWQFCSLELSICAWSSQAILCLVGFPCPSRNEAYLTLEIEALFQRALFHMYSFNSGLEANITIDAG